MFNGFNFKENNCNCPNCRGVQNVEVEHLEIDLETVDYDELLQEWLPDIQQSTSEAELKNVLSIFMEEVREAAYQECLLDQFHENLGKLQAFKYEVDEE